MFLFQLPDDCDQSIAEQTVENWVEAVKRAQHSIEYKPAESQNTRDLISPNVSAVDIAERVSKTRLC